MGFLSCCLVAKFSRAGDPARQSTQYPAIVEKARTFRFRSQFTSKSKNPLRRENVFARGRRFCSTVRPGQNSSAADTRQDCDQASGLRNR